MTRGAFSETRLSRVRDVLARHIDAGAAPGAVTLVARRGERHVEAMGTLAFEGSTAAMATDTICRIASLTKPIVAACAMTLVEDGTLRLDDPVDEWLPEFARMSVLVDPNGPLRDTVAAHRAITLRDLLTFTLGTGMPIGIGITGRDDVSRPTPIASAFDDAFEPPPRPDEFIRRLGELPLLFQPGERWMYELAADVTVVLVARATGRSFGVALDERILRPLGMKDTGFSVDGEQRTRLATGYRRDDTGAAVVEDGPDGRWSSPPDFESGGGGLVSTADDYFAFAAMLLAGGAYRGTRVLSRASVELMTTNQLSPAQKAVSGFWPGYFDDVGWGFGMSVRTRRTHVGPSVGSYGWMGYGSAWYNDPVEDLTTILMVQQFDAPQWRVDFLTAVYQAIDD